MLNDELQFFDVTGDGKPRRIAFRVLEPVTPDHPTLVWLIGLKSDMVSTKAEALAIWCRKKGYGLTRFDYSGHGQSSGAFGDATTSDWIGEAEVMISQHTGSSGPLVLVGSSTGAHIALIALRRMIKSDETLAQRIRGLVLIAPAWDVTELIWNGLDRKAHDEITQTGAHDQPSDYGEPYHITRTFIEDGRKNLLRDSPFDPGRPVLVLQGLLDKSVLPEHARALADVLQGNWVRITEVADAEHRLSRPEDLEKIYSLVEDVIACDAAS